MERREHEDKPPIEVLLQQDENSEEWVPVDDTVIGKTFWWSLGVLAVVVAVAGAWWYVARRPAAVAPEKPIVAAAPEAVVAPVQVPTVPFTDITRDAGIQFTHSNGAYGEKLLPETMGGGVAFLDYDNDGHQDLLFVNGSAWPHHGGSSPASSLTLYRNNGQGHFQDVTEQANLHGSFYGMGVAVGDYDGDGWTDIFVTAVGYNRLFHNDHGVFAEVTEKAGVAGTAEQWSSSAGFFDYNNDGFVDLFVANYVRWSKDIDLKLDYRLTGVGRAYGPPQNYEGTFPYLYRNNGDGTFTEVGTDSGLHMTNPATGLPEAKSLGLAFLDVDHDGYIDVLVANDTVKKYFFHNKGNGTFEEVGELYGLAYGSDGRATGAMGIDAGYFRNDQNIGFMIGNFANEMTSVYVSQDDPTFFVDDAIGEGIGAPSRQALTFGLFLFDVDLDSRLDMLQANGHIETEIHRMDPSQQYLQAAQLFWNAGAGHKPRFVLLAPERVGALTQEIVGRGAAYADIDGDGDLDVVLTQVAGPPLLLRNDQHLGHHWLRVKLRGKSPNHDAIGAWIEIKAGGVTQRRQVMPTRSYLSQVELPVTFGLGTSKSLDALTITWPDGAVQSVEPEAVDRVLVVEQGENRVLPRSRP